jgi:hypothetical protein
MIRAYLSVGRGSWKFASIHGARHENTILEIMWTSAVCAPTSCGQLPCALPHRIIFSSSGKASQVRRSTHQCHSKRKPGRTSMPHAACPKCPKPGRRMSEAGSQGRASNVRNRISNVRNRVPGVCLKCPKPGRRGVPQMSETGFKMSETKRFLDPPRVQNQTFSGPLRGRKPEKKGCPHKSQPQPE